MRFISTNAHGILWGILLAASPWIFGFADFTAAQWVPFALAIGVLTMSMMTRYENSIMKIIPMTLHLTADVAAGIFLAVSPWLLGFSDRVYLPHLIFGVFSVLAGLCTQKSPGITDRSARNATFEGIH